MHPRLSHRRIAIARDSGVFGQVREALVQVADIATHDETTAEALRGGLCSTIRELIEAMDAIDPASNEGKELASKVAAVLLNLKPYLKSLEGRTLEAVHRLQLLTPDP